MKLLFWKRKKEHPVSQYSGKLVQSTKKGREISYRPSFEELNQQHKNVALSVYKFVSKNKAKLERGEKIVDPKTGAIIEKKYTGKYIGMLNVGTYRVEWNGHTFFLKFSKYKFKPSEAFLKARDLIEKKGGVIGGFKFVVLVPQVIYSPRNQRGEIIVTDFIESNGITSLFDSSKNSETKLPFFAERAFRKTQSLLKQNGILDVEKRNALFHEGTKTFFIFDVRDKQMLVQ